MIGSTKAVIVMYGLLNRNDKLECGEDKRPLLLPLKEAEALAKSRSGLSVARVEAHYVATDIVLPATGTTRQLQ